MVIVAWRLAQASGKVDKESIAFEESTNMGRPVPEIAVGFPAASMSMVRTTLPSNLAARPSAE
jgi:hypothetical protein